MIKVSLTCHLINDYSNWLGLEDDDVLLLRQNRLGRYKLVSRKSDSNRGKRLWLKKWRVWGPEV